MLLQITLTLLLTLTYTFATPPPGYQKKEEITTDKNTPKYNYGYKISDAQGSQEKQEQRDGIYAHGRYNVHGQDHHQSVEYLADDWGFHPFIEYSNQSPHSQSSTVIALGEEAVKALHTNQKTTSLLKSTTPLQPETNSVHQTTAPIQLHETVSAVTHLITPTQSTFQTTKLLPLQKEEEQNVILTTQMFPIQQHLVFVTNPNNGQEQTSVTQSSDANNDISTHSVKINHKQGRILNIKNENENSEANKENIAYLNQQPQPNPTENLILLNQQSLNNYNDKLVLINQGNQEQNQNSHVVLLNNAQDLISAHNNQHGQNVADQHIVYINHDHEKLLSSERNNEQFFGNQNQFTSHQPLLIQQDTHANLASSNIGGNQIYQHTTAQFAHGNNQHKQVEQLFQGVGQLENQVAQFAQKVAAQGENVNNLNNQADYTTNLASNAKTGTQQRKQNVKIINSEELKKANNLAAIYQNYKDDEDPYPYAGSFGAKINPKFVQKATTNVHSQSSFDQKYNTNNINYQQDSSLSEKQATSHQQHSNRHNQNINRFIQQQHSSNNYNVKQNTNANDNAYSDEQKTLKLIENTKNLINSQDVLNINDILNHVESSSQVKDVVISNSQQVVSTTEKNEVSLLKEPIVVEEFDENNINEDEYSTTRSTSETEPAEYKSTVVTPRPVATTFLAPITAGVKLEEERTNLLSSEDSNNFNLSSSQISSSINLGDSYLPSEQQKYQFKEQEKLAHNSAVVVDIQKSVPYYIGRFEYVQGPDGIVVDKQVDKEVISKENESFGKQLLQYTVAAIPNPTQAGLLLQQGDGQDGGQILLTKHNQIQVQHESLPTPEALIQHATNTQTLEQSSSTSTTSSSQEQHTQQELRPTSESSVEHQTNAQALQSSSSLSTTTQEEQRHKSSPFTSSYQVNHIASSTHEQNANNENNHHYINNYQPQISSSSSSSSDSSASYPPTSTTLISSASYPDSSTLISSSSQPSSSFASNPPSPSSLVSSTSYQIQHGSSELASKSVEALPTPQALIKHETNIQSTEESAATSSTSNEEQAITTSEQVIHESQDKQNDAQSENQKLVQSQQIVQENQEQQQAVVLQQQLDQTITKQDKTNSHQQVVNHNGQEHTFTQFDIQHKPQEQFTVQHNLLQPQNQVYVQDQPQQILLHYHKQVKGGEQQQIHAHQQQQTSQENHHEKQENQVFLLNQHQIIQENQHQQFLVQQNQQNQVLQENYHQFFVQNQPQLVSSTGSQGTVQQYLIKKSQDQNQLKHILLQNHEQAKQQQTTVQAEQNHNQVLLLPTPTILYQNEHQLQQNGENKEPVFLLPTPQALQPTNPSSQILLEPLPTPQALIQHQINQDNKIQNIHQDQKLEEGQIDYQVRQLIPQQEYLNYGKLNEQAQTGKLISQQQILIPQQDALNNGLIHQQQNLKQDEVQNLYLKQQEGGRLVSQYSQNIVHDQSNGGAGHSHVQVIHSAGASGNSHVPVIQQKEVVQDSRSHQEVLNREQENVQQQITNLHQIYAQNHQYKNVQQMNNFESQKLYPVVVDLRNHQNVQTQPSSVHSGESQANQAQAQYVQAQTNSQHQVQSSQANQNVQSYSNGANEFYEHLQQLTPHLVDESDATKLQKQKPVINFGIKEPQPIYLQEIKYPQEIVHVTLPSYDPKKLVAQINVQLPEEGEKGDTIQGRDKWVEIQQQQQQQHQQQHQQQQHQQQHQQQQHQQQQHQQQHQQQDQQQHQQTILENNQQNHLVRYQQELQSLQQQQTIQGSQNLNQQELIKHQETQQQDLQIGSSQEVSTNTVNSINKDAVKVETVIEKKIPVPYVVEIPKPYPVQVTKLVPQPYPVTVTQTVKVPIPTPVEVKVPHPVPVEVPKYIERPYPIYVNEKDAHKSIYENVKNQNVYANFNSQSKPQMYAPSFDSFNSYVPKGYNFYHTIHYNDYVGLTPPKIKTKGYHTISTQAYQNDKNIAASSSTQSYKPDIKNQLHHQYPTPHYASSSSTNQNHHGSSVNPSTQKKHGYSLTHQDSTLIPSNHNHHGIQSSQNHQGSSLISPSQNHHSYSLIHTSENHQGSSIHSTQKHQGSSLIYHGSSLIPTSQNHQSSSLQQNHQSTKPYQNKHFHDEKISPTQSYPHHLKLSTASSLNHQGLSTDSSLNHQSSYVPYTFAQKQKTTITTKLPQHFQYNYARRYRNARHSFGNLRLEYGFKPPLIPSLEIDENGKPIEKIEDN